MTKPEKKKRLPKAVEKLTSDEVVRRIFGKREAEKLKKVAHEKDPKDPEKP